MTRLSGHARYHQRLRGYGTELNKVCAGAKVVINFVRAEQGAVHSMKTFELPACGACVLTNHTDEQAEFFPEGVVYFRTVDEMNHKLERLLTDDQERARLAQRALAEARPHTYEARARELSKLLAL